MNNILKEKKMYLRTVDRIFEKWVHLDLWSLPRTNSHSNPFLGWQCPGSQNTSVSTNISRDLCNRNLKETVTKSNKNVSNNFGWGQSLNDKRFKGFSLVTRHWHCLLFLLLFLYLIMITLYFCLYLCILQCSLHYLGP